MPGAAFSPLERCKGEPERRGASEAVLSLCPKLCPRRPTIHPRPPCASQPAKEEPLGKSATYRGGCRAPPALEGRCSIRLSYRRAFILADLARICQSTMRGT